MDAQSEAVVETDSDGARFDLETIFVAQYGRVARLIARIIRDPGRAEELAVEIFLKWSRTPSARSPEAGKWLFRAAIHVALDELRKQTRRKRYDGLLDLVRRPLTPEELHAAAQEQDKVRAVLAAMAPRKAELLLLRSEGLNYEELASALDLNPASVGTFLRRAQQAFRKEYLKKYGEE